jgi:ribosomal protein S18 acetylase RimI-like enzyme
VIRRARPEDAPTIAAISRLSRATAMPWLPVLHSAEGDVQFFTKRVVPHHRVEVVENGGEIVGFCSVNDDWVDHLYIHPEHQGKGHGAALIERAKAGQGSLQLWVFEQNTAAQAFYRAHGFAAVEQTDGQGNEEKCPDVRMVWTADTTDD